MNIKIVQRLTALLFVSLFATIIPSIADSVEATDPIVSCRYQNTDQMRLEEYGTSFSQPEETNCDASIWHNGSFGNGYVVYGFAGATYSAIHCSYFTLGSCVDYPDADLGYLNNTSYSGSAQIEATMITERGTTTSFNNAYGVAYNFYP